MQGDDRAAELARKAKERFEESVRALAVVALAKEVYPDDERRRLLAEYKALVEAHDAAVNAAEADRLPDTAGKAEKEAQAISVMGRIREAFEAGEAFGKAHPLIRAMHSQIDKLTGSIYD